MASNALTDKVACSQERLLNQIQKYVVAIEPKTKAGYNLFGRSIKHGMLIT